VKNEIVIKRARGEKIIITAGGSSRLSGMTCSLAGIHMVHHRVLHLDDMGTGNVPFPLAL